MSKFLKFIVNTFLVVAILTAAAILVPPLLGVNTTIVDTAGMDQDAYRKAAIDAVQQLSIDVGIPTKLEKLKEEDLPFLCESAAADACAPGNPREASLADFEAMFRKLM